MSLAEPFNAFHESLLLRDADLSCCQLPNEGQDFKIAARLRRFEFPLDDGSLAVRSWEDASIIRPKNAQEDIGLVDHFAAALFGARAARCVPFVQVELIDTGELGRQFATLICKARSRTQEHEQLADHGLT